MGYKTLRSLINDLGVDIRNQNQAIQTIQAELTALKSMIINTMPKTIGATEHDDNN